MIVNYLYLEEQADIVRKIYELYAIVKTGCIHLRYEICYRKGKGVMVCRQM